MHSTYGRGSHLLKSSQTSADTADMNSTPPPNSPGTEPVTKTTVVAHQEMMVTGGWYFVAVLIPIIGVILGIVAASRNQVGPALALWATSIVVAPIFWVLFWICVVAGQ